jgi:hypothetical protein
MKRRAWSTIELLNEWYKLNGSRERKDNYLPFDDDLYQKSIIEDPKQG